MVSRRLDIDFGPPPDVAAAVAEEEEEEEEEEEDAGFRIAEDFIVACVRFSFPFSILAK